MGLVWQEKCIKLLMVFAFMALLACLALQGYLMYAASNDTWFTPCDECAARDDTAASEQQTGETRDSSAASTEPTETAAATKVCVFCCSDCDIRDAIYYYVMRVYNVVFLVFAIVAEIRPDKYLQYVRICNFFGPRGFMQIFTGLMTVSGAQHDTRIYGEVLGYILVAVGVIHLICMCACVGFDSDGKKSKNEAPPTAGEAAAAAPARSASYEMKPSPATAGGKDSTYDYQYNGQTYQYPVTGPAAI